MLGRALLLLIWAASTLLAQNNPFGRITGRLMDQSNAMVRGAQIRAVRLETNVTVASASNAEGNFELLNLVPGSYRLVIEAPGFKRYERGPMEVRVGDVLSIPVRLELGAQAESVTVNSEAPLLESATASVNQVVDSRRLLDLPTPSGAISYLITTMPSVVSTVAVGQLWGLEARNQHNSFVVAGTPVGSTGQFLDGIPNTKIQESNAPSFVAPAEAVQEMRVETARFDASLGRLSGAYINMVLKSGTNELHANLAYGFYGTPLMTKPFFVNKSLYDLSSGPPTPEKERRLWPYTRENRYTATIGGPVLIPHVYNGRNRTFWQFTFDLGDRVWASIGQLTVPTAKERAGNFSDLLALNSSYQVYDPATIAAAAGGRFSRQPFPGNIIPAGRLNPMSMKILEYYPAANAGGAVDGRQNWQGAAHNWLHMNQQIVRVDQAIGSRQRFFVSMTTNTQNQQQNDYFSNGSSGNHYYPWAHKGLSFDDTITLRPNLVLDIRYGLSRFVQNTTPPSLGSVNLASLGLSPNLVSQLDPSRAALPYTQIDQYQTLGASTLYNTNSGELTHSLLGSATYVRGMHSLRFGGELRIQQDNVNEFNTAYAPVYNFDSGRTKGPLDTSPAASIGQGLAAFLLGIPSGYIDRIGGYSGRARFLAGFFQDDWKVSRRLTVNLGVRYEFEVPVSEAYNRANRGFDFKTSNPISAVAQANYASSPIPEIAPANFRTVGGLLFAGAQGVPRGMWDSNSRNFAPMVGLSYLLQPRTVIRAGYGIYYQPLGLGYETSVYQQGFTQRTQIRDSDDNGLTFRANIQNPFPEGLVAPPGASAGLKTFLGNGISFFSADRRNGYMQRWSFSIQRELTPKMLLEIGYTGNRGTALGFSQDLNSVPAQYLSKSPLRDQSRIDYLATQVSNPFYGMPEFAGTGYAGKTVARSVLLRPYPQFGAMNTTTDGGFSWYHDAHLRLEKRFSRGYTFQVSYTWSKFMDATTKLNASDPTPQHVISMLDRPHHLSVSGIYEVPVGRGKALLAKSPAWLDGVASGWTVQGMYTAQTGPPIAFGNIGFYGDVHDISLPGSQRTVERWFNTGAGFETDSKKALGSNIRTFPSQLNGVRAAGANNFDLSLFKYFRIREKVRFQLRGEAWNAMNHAAFAAPNANPTSSLFGQVSATQFSRQRTIQVGGRLRW